MANTKRITETVKVNSQLTTVTSAAGATSIPVDMAHASRAAFIMTAEGATFGRIAYDLMKSTAATAAGTSAAGGTTQLEIGSSVNTSIPSSRGVQSVLLVCGTDGTGATGNAITLGVGTVTKTYIWSTSTALYNSSAWTATKIYFGSTVGSTVNTGQQLAMGMLGSALINTTYGFGNAVVYSTPATNTILLSRQGGATADGNISFGATGATQLIVAGVQRAVGAIEIETDALSTGERWLSVKCSTSSTSVRTAVTCLRGGLRYGAGRFNGNCST